jgi:hypothetical protein
MRPTIAIVGSVAAHREAALGLTNVDIAPAACEALGRELAERDQNIIVYSSDPAFIEGAIVRGYAASGKATAGSIQIHYPESSAHGTFPEMQQNRDWFDPIKDTDEGWEVSYYRSLKDVDGILLVGGGQSTLVTGLIAVTFGKPVVAVATFGGAAKKVRQTIANSDTVATPQQIAAMGRDWHDGSAAELVDALLQQRARAAEIEAEARRADRAENRRKAISLGIGAVLLLIALAAIPVVRGTDPGSTINVIALILAPTLAGVFGAIVRTSVDEGTRWLQSALLGLGAGALAALLFVASQLATSPKALEEEGVNTLIVFMVLVGAIAGLTFDAVYKKLTQEVDIADTSAFKRP